MKNGRHYTGSLGGCGGLPSYIWLHRLLARIVGSQPTEGRVGTS